MVLFFPGPGIQIKEEPDSEEWQLSGDSTLNPSDLNNLRVQMADEDMETPSGEGKRLRRVACTCPNCKESGGRWASGKHTLTDTQILKLLLKHTCTVIGNNITGFSARGGKHPNVAAALLNISCSKPQISFSFITSQTFV